MKWTSWANLFIGSWLLFSPSALGIFGTPLAINDLVAGILVSLLSISDLLTARPWKRWALSFVGAWLLFAPLVFWTKSAGAYHGDTIAGIFLIVFSVAIPSQTIAGNGVPPGWSYNPSIWHHRIPVIVLALFGFFVARYMAAFQLEHIGSVWEPFFGDGTVRVLTSEVSKVFPVSDAGLGAATYLLEALSGLVGDTRRWRTMPWMVFLFFVLVVPAGVVSIVLIMLQPVVVGAWCSLCLVTAVTTLISIPPAVDEVFASGQFLIRVRREGKSVWAVFWRGDGSASPHRRESPHRDVASGLSGMSGIGFTWNLAVVSLLGVGLVLTPALFGISGRTANIDYVVGAMVTTFAVLATAEPIRSIRFINVPLGLVVVAAPFVGNATEGSMALHVLTGLAMAALSLPKGKIEESYGGWNRFIR